ncbi:MAG TPA: XdhC family protein [Stenotrophomonas sp.]|jgi:xanthine dehydrogenase accessory factor
MTAARHCIEASLAALGDGGQATLAVVMATEGSTYVKSGALALFAADGRQQGWLSGGCLEPEIAARALEALQYQRLDLMDIDTRDDDALLSGAATGCRGRLHLALLPLSLLEGWASVVEGWRARRGALRLSLDEQGQLQAAVGEHRRQWHLAGAVPAQRLHARIEPPPRVAVFGAGPETLVLLPWLRQLGWLTTLVEKRPRWRDQGALADHHVTHTPSQALAEGVDADAVLVMHHNFELDRETLEALASHPASFIGLLGPRRRQQDLFQVLGAAQREALGPRLRSPIGIKLGGDGPEAIALSVAAQLQRWRDDEDLPA